MQHCDDVEKPKQGILLKELPGQVTLFYNHSGRIIRNVDPMKWGLIDLTYKNKDMLYNEELHILNCHYMDKTPGTNPVYEDYQRKKYDFWKEHRYEFEYLDLLGIDTTIQQIQEFQKFVSDQGYDVKKFHIFNRFKGLDLSSLEFNVIDISNGYDDDLDMKYIPYMNNTILDYCKLLLKKRGLT